VEVARSVETQTGEHLLASAPKHASGGAFFEVAKVLLEVWLRRRCPLQSSELEGLVGASYPTVSSALQELEARGELERKRVRRVELRGVPLRTLREIVIRADEVRHTRWYVDALGRPPNPELLLRRLRKARLPGVGVGEVPAGHHYDPNLDLIGLPRIDLTLSTGIAERTLRRLSEVDPALRLSAKTRRDEAVLVVHSLSRNEPLFERAADETYADPVETMLDLYELHLDEQAETLAKRLRAAS
jgi:hypothetical protein